ncbi:MAG: hypothetical protein F4Y02_06045 [Chloroflexi bacterium]|nr:hypothetical protein [Chloroflexota bacterium]
MRWRAASRRQRTERRRTGAGRARRGRKVTGAAAFCAVLCLSGAAGALPEEHYVTSLDGHGHWLSLAPAESTVRDAEADRKYRFTWPCTQCAPPVLHLYCRTGPADSPLPPQPLQAELRMRALRHDPAAAQVVNPADWIRFVPMLLGGTEFYVDRPLAMRAHARGAWQQTRARLQRLRHNWSSESGYWAPLDPHWTAGVLAHPGPVAVEIRSPPLTIAARYRVGETTRQYLARCAQVARQDS